MTRDYATDPTERILAAERRRELRALLDAGSLGSPGAQIMRRTAGRDVALTPDEQGAVDAEMADLERELRGPR